LGEILFIDFETWRFWDAVSLAHSQMDSPKYSMLPASFFNGCRDNEQQY